MPLSNPMTLLARFLQKEASAEPPHLRTGRWGEQLAARMLKKKGYKLLGQRVRVGRRDELDIVARDKETLVFVEVKTRSSERFGRPVDAVSQSKQRTLSRGAVRYVKRLKTRPPYIRFDVVEVIGSPDSGDPEIRHITNAFQMAGGYRLQW